MTSAPHTAPFATSREDDLLTALGRGRRRLMIAGVIAMVLGAVSIIVPAVGSVGTAIFIGWVLVFASGFMIIDALSVRHTGRMALRLVLAVLTFAAGFYLLVAPLDGVFTLTVVLVIWFVATGTARVIVGIAERGLPGAGMTIFSGLVSLGLGILIAEKLPSSANWAIGLIVGIDLFFAGAVLVVLTSRLRRVIP
jgi:uncharacterized membrane protein HdeD (DUF308 family)